MLKCAQDFWNTLYRSNLLHVKMQHIVGHGRTRAGRYIPSLSNVWPWDLFMVIECASLTGNCIMQISMNGTFWRTSDDRTPLGRFNLKITHARHNTGNDGG